MKHRAATVLRDEGNSMEVASLTTPAHTYAAKGKLEWITSEPCLKRMTKSCPFFWKTSQLLS